jgi:trigger factor
MLQEIEEITPTTKKLKINIPPDVIEAEIASAYNKLRASVRIPGFRPGKVPQAILEKRFSKNVEAQVIEKIVPEFYSKALKEANLEPVSYPDINGEMELKPNQPLSFTVTVEVKPDVRELHYEGIVLKKKTFSVEEEEVERALKSLQESKAVYTVSEDEIREGDMVVINYETWVDGQLHQELSQKDYPLIHGTDTAPKEFSNALLGKKKGETVEVKLNFDNAHPNKTIAGKEVLFKILITEIKKKNIPSLDDEFAKSFNCKNVEELRNKIRDDITERKKNQINSEYKKELIENLINNHNFEVPASMVSRELEFLILEAKQDALKKGEAIKSDEELRKEYELTARDNVKGAIILEAISKKENIKVTNDEINEAIDEIALRTNLKPEEVKKFYITKEGSMDSLKNKLFAEKVLNHLLEKAVIE